MTAAWSNFRAGRFVAAEQQLGQISDQEVFVVPQGRAPFARITRLFVFALAPVAGLLVVLSHFRQQWFNHLAPVKLSESQVRTFLNDTTPNSDPTKLRTNSATTALTLCLVLPTTNLFDSVGMHAMHEEMFRDAGATSLPPADARISWLCNSPQIRRALVSGWLDWKELGVTPAEVATELRRDPKRFSLNFNPEFLLVRERAQSWVQNQGWVVKRPALYTVEQLRWLRAVNCLDFVDRDRLIQQIASVQTLSARSAPGQPSIYHWRDVRGLFFTPGWPALQHTWFALASLEILGGLDRIDREQCIRGILREHKGKGYFSASNEYGIRGDARDTFCAFESLRILGALDRVKDLDDWEFRVRSAKPGVVTWDQVEAWVFRQRFERAMRDRREYPQLPTRSLLEP